MFSVLSRGLLLTAALLSLPVSAQDTVLLKMSLSPDTAFRLSQTSVNDMVMDASKAWHLPRNDENQQFPMHIQQKAEQVSRLETSAVDADGSFLVSMTIESGTSSVSVNEGFWTEQPGLSDYLGQAMMEARILSNGEMQFISVGGQPVPPEMEAMMASLFEQFTGTGMLDDVEVALGQTVPVRLPMTVPVAELGNMEIEIIMYYTLNSIENGLGNFGIGMDMQMSMEIQESLVTVTAKGDGRMVYDIAGEYTPYSDIDMTMNFNIPVEKGGVTMALNSHTVVEMAPLMPVEN